MKKYFMLAFLTALAVISYSNNWKPAASSEPQPPRIELVSSDIESSVIRIQFENYLLREVETPLGEARIVGLPNATPVLEKGCPDIPKLTASVIIPDMAAMSVEVIESDYTEVEDLLVAPSKGNLTRDIDPATVPYEFGKVYQQDAYWPGDLAGLRDPYIVRDFRGQTVIFYPFQYNPVSKTLRVYHSITVKVHKSGEPGTNPLVRSSSPGPADAGFHHLYSGRFLNYTNANRYDPVAEFGNFLIISYADFMPAMDPFIQWKKQMGYPVEIVDVASVGNSTAIKTFIQDYYDTKGVTFVLLVGDHAQVPTSSTTAGDSDNNYSYVAGNDHYPDLFIGRFSAETVQQVETQVERTVTYEKNPRNDLDWFTICTGIASNQGPGDDGEYDYEHIRNIQDDLLAYTYTYNNELFDGSQGGNDEPGNPTPAQVADDVNTGTSIINYTGHGSKTSWGTSGFSSTDVNNLVNDNMLPFVWSVACVNGDFKVGTCFAEAWLRATNNGEPTGAIAFLGSTINQSWNPPMAAQDEMNDILVETYPDNINRTFGALSMHGCMLMNDEYGGGGADMTDTWTCFGDPSVTVRTAVPAEMTVNHDPILFVGASELLITTDVEGARATLMDGSTVIATGVVEGGSLVLSFQELSDIGVLTLTLTAYNYLPYIQEIEIIPAEGPYVVMEAYQIHDLTGNNNGHADYDELVNLTVEMGNVGVEDAVDVMVTLSTSDEYVTITDNFEDYGTIPAGEITFIEDAFEFLVEEDVPDQHQVIFTLTSSSAEGSWQSNFIIKLNAPILTISSMVIEDDETGNGNGQLDPGERANIKIHYTNSGHTPARNCNVTLEALCGSVEILNPSINVPSIGLFGGANVVFEATVDDDAPVGTLAPLENTVTSAGLVMIGHTFAEKISPLCEDFETGNFTSFNWQHDGDLPWSLIMDFPYEGYFSARSGAIGNSQTSELTVTFDIMVEDSISFYRKVSSESGDKLKFFINNTLQGEWSGTAGGWKREAFNVTPGMRTFKWIYEKNGSASGGTDRAWIDYIIFPPERTLTVWAGRDMEICPETDVALLGEATDQTSVEWTTSGTGTFSDPLVLDPVYTPSSSDLEDGSVLLTLTVWDDGNNSMADEISVSFIDVPGVPLTPTGDDYVNVTYTASSVYSTDGIEGIDEYSWQLEPAGAGSIINHGDMGVVVWNPAYLGLATVTVAAVNDCGPGEFSDGFIVTVDNLLGTGPDEMTSENILVMPNPSDGNFRIVLPRELKGPVNIRLADLSGRVILERQESNLSSGATLVLHAGDVPEGIYLITVRNAENRLTKKVVIF